MSLSYFCSVYFHADCAPVIVLFCREYSVLLKTIVYYFLKINYSYLCIETNDLARFFDNVNTVSDSGDTVGQNKYLPSTTYSG